MAPLTNIHDTVRMPWREELVVRPVLGILYRLALGARAEVWVPRFLRFERNGRAAIGWHWPAFLFPAVWAFYRRMWIAGGILAALPFGLAALFVWIDPSLRESPTAWLACAIAVIWLLPCVVAALAADSLLFWRVKHQVREAEATSDADADDRGGPRRPRHSELRDRSSTLLVRVSRPGQGHLRSIPDRSLGRLQRRDELAVVHGLENAACTA